MLVCTKAFIRTGSSVGLGPGDLERLGSGGGGGCRFSGGGEDFDRFDFDWTGRDRCLGPSGLGAGGGDPGDSNTGFGGRVGGFIGTAGSGDGERSCLKT
jgi:hypothetical protein